MGLLIDGYNVMFAVGLVPDRPGPGRLHRSRLDLLNFVADSLDPTAAAEAVVVFDAAEAPPGLPRTLSHRGLTVHFASDHESADALIEELLLADSAPKRLTVVSSDHRLQRAARRRRATAIDSDVWYDQALRARQNRPLSPSDAKPTEVTEREVEYWLNAFAVEDDSKSARDAGDIFPPGYGEDLEDR